MRPSSHEAWHCRLARVGGGDLCENRLEILTAEGAQGSKKRLGLPRGLLVWERPNRHVKVRRVSDAIDNVMASQDDDELRCETEALGLIPSWLAI